jgi:integrase
MSTARTTRSTRYGTGTYSFDSARGLWVGTVDLPRHPDGRRNRKRVSHRDRDTMLAAFRELQARVANGERVQSAPWTVRSWGDHYLAHLAPPKSRDGYANALEYWVYPHVGKRQLAKLQPEHVDMMLAALEHQGLSDATRAKARKVLSAVLTAALKRHYVRENVAKMTACPPQRRRQDPLTVAEVETVLAHVQGDRLEALAVLALAVGMRQGECVALRWSAVDLKARTLDVTDAKTEAGVRTVPLPAMVVDALKAHQAAQRVERVAADVWGDPDLVFVSPVGTALSGQWARRWWYKVTTGAGIGPWIDAKGIEHRRRFHATRHTAATVMLNHGTPLEVVSAILGHASIAITGDIYAKPSGDHLRTGADAIDRLFGAKSAPAGS